MGPLSCSPAHLQAGLGGVSVQEGAAFAGLLAANSSIDPERFQMQTADVIDVFILYLLFSHFAFLSIYLAIYLCYLYTVSIYLTMLRVSV